MTQQEFTERTGITPTEDDFARIHEMYMATSLDKNEFCQHYTEALLDNPIVENIVTGRRVYREAYNNIKEKANKAIDVLLDVEAEYDYTEAYEMAVELGDQRDITLRKVKAGYPLNEADKEYLIKHI